MLARIRLSALVALALASPALPAADERPRFVEGELLVRFRDAPSAARAHAALRAALLRRDARLRLDRVRLPAGLSVEDAARRYGREPGVRYAEPNWIVRKGATSDDPLAASQWGLGAIAAFDAWDVTTGSASVAVAVVDTGIRLAHPDLAANLWTNDPELVGTAGVDDDGNGVVDDVHGARFRNGAVSGDPIDDDVAESHGTHVAGTIGAVGNDGTGVAGVSWTVRLMAVKVLHGSRGEGTVADLVAGIGYALDAGARIVNCSLTLPPDAWSQALADAFAEADARGALMVTAAGNATPGIVVGTRGLVNPGGTVLLPASIRSPGQIDVAALARDGSLAGYSNRGERTVDLAAPGGLPPDWAPEFAESAGILSTVSRCTDNDEDGRCDVLGSSPVNGYGYLAGTSMAAPHVSGVAALVWSAYPALGHRAVKARILNATAPAAALAGVTLTGGRLDAASALSPAAGGIPAVFRVSPYFALPGDLVTIEGASFGAAAGTVRVGLLPLEVQAWSDETIVAAVPAGASSGPVQVNGEGVSFPLRIDGAPSIALAATPRVGVSPLEVTFTASVEDAAGDVVKHEWDFGSGTFREYDGVTSTAVVTLERAGLHTARARVTDAAGRSATAEAAIFVGQPGADGRCFIATAAWGSPLHPRVQALRAFRDRWLLTSAPGRALVRAYYAVSPPLADLVRRHEPLRAAARWALAPAVVAIEHPPLALAAVVTMAAAALLVRQRRNRWIRR